MNLKALLYDPADNHKALADSVEALVPKVEAASPSPFRTEMISH